MTGATPLASEQITQEQRALDAVHNLIVLCRLKFGNSDESANIAMEEGEWLLARIAALSASPAPSGQGSLERYDAGLLGNGGGGDVEWWQDYLRAELERAHDFYADQWESQS